MEMTFYDDNQFRGGTGDEKTLKRPATLDLDSSNSATKKQKYNSILSSPDLNMLKLRTPELEKFIMANCAFTATPTPTQVYFPKTVTEAQEDYAKGFIDALNHLHQSVEVDQNPSRNGGNSNLGLENASNNMQKIFMPIYITPATTSVIKSSGSPKNNNVLNVRPPSVESTNSSTSCNSNSLPVPLEFSVKEELQTVPSDFSSPPLSPITNLSKTPVNMEEQERIKLERKRYRNRIAASKCRRRKLEKIAQLEDKVKDLKGENSKLEAVAERLREQVCQLKLTVLDHAKKGCQIMKPPL